MGLTTPMVLPMPSRLLAVTFDVRDPAQVARFWADMLGRNVVETSRGAVLRGDATQLGLGFVPCHIEKAGPNRVHLHLTSTTVADQQHTVEKALGLGARHLDVGQRPEEGHVVLADPGDNEFCVIEPGSDFLAGCGFLGELACDGTQEVGYFWSEALGWPLVWDQNQETAIQSPGGGTKIAWGGPPLRPKTGKNRMHFDLAPPADGDQQSEVDRLLSLGATRIDIGQGEVSRVVMADPDGHEFCVLGGLDSVHEQ